MKRGFTLIELLIVIAILAIIATTIAVVMNPAQMLKEARDSQRMSDLKSIQSALSLYLVSVSNPQMPKSGESACKCTGKTGSGNVYAKDDTDGGFTSATCAADNDITTDGTGWVAINLNDIPAGSPLSSLPLDPVNDDSSNGEGVDGGFYYIFGCSSSTLTFELNCNMESTKYSDLEGKDGGDNSNIYEIGSDPGLDLI